MTDKQLLPFPTEYKMAVTNGGEARGAHTIDELLNDLDVLWSWNSQLSYGLCFAKENVWSRSARRKKKKKPEVEGELARKHQDVSDDEEYKDDAQIGVKIVVADNEVVVEWLKGTDRVLFESFCGMLKRAIDTRT